MSDKTQVAEQIYNNLLPKERPEVDARELEIDETRLDEKEKEVSRKSTLKGDKIEDTLLLNLENLFPGNDLTFNKLTNTTGELKNSKKGDYF